MTDWGATCEKLTVSDPSNCQNQKAKETNFNNEPKEQHDVNSSDEFPYFESFHRERKCEKHN